MLKGNLFNNAIMKTSVISKEFQDRYLSTPGDLGAFEGRAIVFDGPEDYHHRIDDPALDIDERCLLFIHSLPCIGDGRQSGTSASPSILNASPEAAAGGGLAILKTGDRVRIDLNKRTADIMISEGEVQARHAALRSEGGFRYAVNQTPWQEIQRGMVDQFDEGMVLKPAVKYQRAAQTMGVPRDNH